MSVCIFRLRYPAFNEHVPPFYLRPVRLYNCVPHFLINDTIFEKKTEQITCVLIFSTNSSETFLILIRNERDVIKMHIGLHILYTSCTVHFMYSTLHVQHTSCTVHFMYSTLHVLYTSCTVHFMYNTLHVQYTSCTVHFMYSTLYSCQILTNLSFYFNKFSKKFSNIIFHERPSSGSRVVTCGLTDGRTDEQTWS